MTRKLPSILLDYSHTLPGAKPHSSFYLGKKVAFVYRAQREIRGSKIRVIWGKITRSHGMPLFNSYDSNSIEN